MIFVDNLKLWCNIYETKKKLNMKLSSYENKNYIYYNKAQKKQGCNFYVNFNIIYVQGNLEKSSILKIY